MLCCTSTPEGKVSLPVTSVYGSPTCALYGEMTATLAVLRSWGKACISSR